MENYLFYGYLKWQKDNKKNTKRKSVVPIIGKILFGLIIISFISAIVLALIKSTVSYVPICIQLLCYVLMFFYTELLLTNNSSAYYNNHKEYCEKLYLFIDSFSITEKEEIAEMRNRILAKLIKIKSDTEKRKKRLDKWMQILVIPIALAILNNMINNQTDLNTVYKYIFSIIAMFIMIYLTVYAILIITNAINKMRQNQYQCFCDDLQGVIDCKFGITSTKP